MFLNRDRKRKEKLARHIPDRFAPALQKPLGKKAIKEARRICEAKSNITSLLSHRGSIDLIHAS
jgi:hypothetical protein